MQIGLIFSQIDASVNEQTRIRCFGVILRDSAGELVLGYFGHFPGITFTFIAKTLASRETLKWLLARNFSSVILKVDCQMLPHALLSTTINHSEAASVIFLF